MIKIVSLIVIAGVLSGMVICKPHWLADNVFLQQFVNHEAIALMAVILTVTLASVANIHLALNRMVMKKFKDNAEIKAASATVKREMRDNAWLIFWGFTLTFVLLLIKGLNDENLIVLASINGIVVWTIFLFIACMFDIYQVVFGIADLELSLGGSTGPSEDFSSDSPELNRGE